MKRILVAAIVFFAVCLSAGSQDFLSGKELHSIWDWTENGVDYAGLATMSFKDGELHIALAENYYDSKSYDFRWKYSIITDHVYSVLKAKGTEWVVIPYEDKAVVFLNKKFGWTAYAYSAYDEWVADYATISASSYLTEKGVEYRPENLKGGPPNLPWVSGNGYGIGDRIDITGLSRTRALLLLNGYVSFDKRYLYEQNSRVKRIKVTSLETKRSKELVLKDIPKFQKIEIADLFPDQTGKGETTFEITVLEVYPGSKYKDLCIYRIVPDFTDR